MSYRDERKAILEQSDKETRELIKELEKDAEEDAVICVSMPESYAYDYFFRTLLQLRHAIITRDLSALPDNFYQEVYKKLKPLTDDSLFARSPVSVGGMEEYYTVYLNVVRKYFKRIDADLEEAIEENIKAYQRLSQLVPETPQTPIDTNPAVTSVKPTVIATEMVKRDSKYKTVNYETIPQRATPDTFKEYKEDRETYYHVRKYGDRDLFILYLNRFIQRIERDYDAGLFDKAYPCETRKDEGDKKKSGRKDFLNLRDGLFMMVDACSMNVSFKDYHDYVMPDLVRKGIIKKAYTANVMTKFLRESTILELLDYMTCKCAEDMNEFDRIYAIDGTGFSSNKKSEYYQEKHLKTQPEKRRKIMWTNLHAIIGVRSNMIVSSDIYYMNEISESTNFIPLVKKALYYGYEMDELLADKAYTSTDARAELKDMGVGAFYCEFKTNKHPPAPNDTSQWAIEYRIWKNQPEVFNAHYHKRSKIEAVFGAIKEKMGETLNSKSKAGCAKEVYGKIIAHNIQCLIMQAFLNGIIPEYVTRDEILQIVTPPK